MHAGSLEDACGSVATPIHQTSTFAFRDAPQGADRFAGTADGHTYTRIGNPTITALEAGRLLLDNVHLAGWPCPWAAWRPSSAAPAP